MGNQNMRQCGYCGESLDWSTGRRMKLFLSTFGKSGKRVYFCSEKCKESFRRGDDDPDPSYSELIEEGFTMLGVEDGS